MYHEPLEIVVRHTQRGCLHTQAHGVRDCVPKKAQIRFEPRSAGDLSAQRSIGQGHVGVSARDAAADVQNSGKSPVTNV